MSCCVNVISHLSCIQCISQHMCVYVHEYHTNHMYHHTIQFEYEKQNMFFNGIIALVLSAFLIHIYIQLMDM